ncbi:MAG: hypothetical protein AAF290_16105 [Pseudomonadota bacterium]
MPRPRKLLVCPDDTPYYHVMSRCVRRAFLCGVDHYSGKSYEHRRQWIQDRVHVLSSIFSVDVCAYAIMSNHYHLVIRIDATAPEAWTVDEVLHRWTTLFKGPLLVQQYLAGNALSSIESQTLTEIVEVYRQRLSSLSWFMRCLNEPIARRANAEDRCTGHFWESRFISQALKTQRALIGAMAYVDLNPIRAGIAETPESSEYTSIKERLLAFGNPNRSSDILNQAVQQLLSTGKIRHRPTTLKPLLKFQSESDAREENSPAVALPMTLTDYIELVDATGRVAIQGKRGSIADSVEPILKRLSSDTERFVSATIQFKNHYRAGDIVRRKTK